MNRFNDLKSAKNLIKDYLQELKDSMKNTKSVDSTQNNIDLNK